MARAKVTRYLAAGAAGALVLGLAACSGGGGGTPVMPGETAGLCTAAELVATSSLSDPFESPSSTHN